MTFSPVIIIGCVFNGSTVLGFANELVISAFNCAPNPPKSPSPPNYIEKTGDYTFGAGLA